MDRSFNCTVMTVVAALLILATSPNGLLGPDALATPPQVGPNATVVVPPDRSPGPTGGHRASSRGSGPDAGQIIGGLLQLGAEAARQRHETESTRPWPGSFPQPNPSYPPHENYPSYPWPQPFPSQPPPDQFYPVPQPNKVYTPPTPGNVYSKPRRNDLPATQPNQLSATKSLHVPVEAVRNSSFSLAGRGVTPMMLAAWKGQTDHQVHTVADKIGQFLPDDSGAAAQMLDQIVGKTKAGTLTTKDLHALADLMRPSLPGKSARGANFLFNRLAVLSRLKALLETGVPGGGPVPAGNNVPMALVPGLPRGTIIVLGNGAVLVGVGDLCRYVAVGRGNVAQAAGMCVGIGAPVVECEPCNAKLPARGALLTNGEDLEVNYNVNDRPYTMQPKYRQTLPAGRSWLVAFDRGGNHGLARYTVSEGTYKFMVTEKGWDLFKQSFRVTVDNGENPFEFFYTVDDRPARLPPGKAQDHSGPFPLVIRFDNGRGQTKAKQVESGRYRVAVTQENALDLFPEDAVVGPSISAPEPNLVASSSVPSPLITSTPPTTSTPPGSSAPAAAPAPNEMPDSTVAAAGGGAGDTPFGDEGDWRPSLFVSDVPEVAYFDVSQSAEGAKPAEKTG